MSTSNQNLTQAQEESLERSRAHLKNALQSVEESHAIADATLVELNRQNEQLRETSNKMDKIGTDLDTSERILRGMQAFAGRIKNVFTKAPPPRGGAAGSKATPDDGAQRAPVLSDDEVWLREQQKAQASNNAPNKAPTAKPGNPFASSASQFREEEDDAKSNNPFAQKQLNKNNNSSSAKNGTTATSAREQEIDDDLDALGGALKSLKVKSMSLGMAIDEGSEIQDELTVKVDAENSRMKNVNKKINKML